jgi:hypothetical protein
MAIPKFSNYIYNPTYSGMPLDEYKSLVDETANRYDRAELANDKLTTYLESIRTADTSGRSQAVIDAAKEKLKQSIDSLAKDARGNTRWDLAERQAKDLGIKFYTDPTLRGIEENYRASQKDIEAKNEMISKGINPLEFSKGHADFDESGKFVPYSNRYAPQLAWGKRAQELVSQIAADSYDTMEISDYEALPNTDPRRKKYDYKIGNRMIDKAKLDSLENDLVTVAQNDDILGQMFRVSKPEEARQFIRSAANIRQFKETSLQPIDNTKSMGRGTAGDSVDVVQPTFDYTETGSATNIGWMDAQKQQEYLDSLLKEPESGMSFKDAFVRGAVAQSGNSKDLENYDKATVVENTQLEKDKKMYTTVGELYYNSLKNKENKTKEEKDALLAYNKDKAAYGKNESKFFKKLGVEQAKQGFSTALEDQKYGNSGYYVPRGMSEEVAKAPQRILVNNVYEGLSDFVPMDGTMKKDTKSLQAYAEEKYGSGYKFAGAEPTGYIANTAFVEKGEDMTGGAVMRARFVNPSNKDDVKYLNIAIKDKDSQKSFADTRILSTGLQEVSNIDRTIQAMNDYKSSKRTDGNITIRSNSAVALPNIDIRKALGDETYVTLIAGLKEKGMSDTWISKVLPSIKFQAVRKINMNEGTNNTYIEWGVPDGGDLDESKTLLLYNTLLKQAKGKDFKEYTDIDQIKTSDNLYIDFDHIMKLNGDDYTRRLMLPSNMTPSKASEAFVPQSNLLNRIGGQ